MTDREPIRRPGNPPGAQTKGQLVRIGGVRLLQTADLLADGKRVLDVVAELMGRST